MANGLTTCLWFDSEAEDAANYYVETFKDRGGKMLNIQKYPEAAQEVSGKPAGSVMTVEFELGGSKFLGLNGGKQEGFKLNPSTSFIVECDTQAEIDHFWERLSAVPEAEQCGWCTDKFGVTWQIAPKILNELMADPTKAEKVTKAFLNMKKLDLEVIRKAGE